MSRRRWSGLAVAVILAGCGAPKAPAPPPDGASAADPAPSWMDGASAAEAAALAPPEGEPMADDGQAAEVAQERIVQRDLPRSNDPLWTTLATTRITEDRRTGLFSATHPPPVLALAGRTVTVQGFMLPIEPEENTRHFLLSRYTPVCFFCPPGAPNEVIEVRTDRPIKAAIDMITVSGRLSLADNGEKGLFFRIEGSAKRP